MENNEKITTNSSFSGSSPNSYDDAIGQALSANTLNTDKDCMINTVIYGMFFKDGIYHVSIQIIVTRTVSKPTIHHDIGMDENPNEKLLHHIDPAVAVTHALFGHPEEDILLEFNNESIGHALETQLEHTWEINPNSVLADKLTQELTPHFEMTLTPDAELTDEEPQLNFRFYTEVINDIELLVPPQHVIGLEIIRHALQKHSENTLKTSPSTPNPSPTPHPHPLGED